MPKCQRNKEVNEEREESSERLEKRAVKRVKLQIETTKMKKVESGT